MFRLIADEFLKLKRSWVLFVAPVMFLMSPLLGVLTARANSARDPDRIQFDWTTIFTQVELDSSILIAPLVMGSMAIYLVHREYQERTLPALLTRPTKPSHLVAAKSILVLLLGVFGALLGSLGTIPLALGMGAPALDSAAVLDGTIRLLGGNTLVVPCALLLIVVVLVSRNYLIAVSCAFASIVFGMMALNLSEFCYFVPWVAPTLLSVDAKTLESLGLEKTELVKSAATYVVFTISIVTALLVLVEKRKE